MSAIATVVGCPGTSSPGRVYRVCSRRKIDEEATLRSARSFLQAFDVTKIWFLTCLCWCRKTSEQSEDLRRNLADAIRWGHPTYSSASWVHSKHHTQACQTRSSHQIQAAVRSTVRPRIALERWQQASALRSALPTAVVCPLIPSLFRRNKSQGVTSSSFLLFKRQ